MAGPKGHLTWPSTLLICFGLFFFWGGGGLFSWFVFLFCFVSLSFLEGTDLCFPWKRAFLLTFQCLPLFLPSFLFNFPFSLSLCLCLSLVIYFIFSFSSFCFALFCFLVSVSLFIYLVYLLSVSCKEQHQQH